MQPSHFRYGFVSFASQKSTNNDDLSNDVKLRQSSTMCAQSNDTLCQ